MGFLFYSFHLLAFVQILLEESCLFASLRYLGPEFLALNSLLVGHSLTQMYPFESGQVLHTPRYVIEFGTFSGRDRSVV